LLARPALRAVTIEPTDHDARVVAHPLAQATLTRLRDADTDRVAFREGLVRLGRVCGHDLVDDLFETTPTAVRTPLAETTGARVAGAEDVVFVTVLRAAAPFVEGLLDALPDARQGMVSASRDEAAGPTDDGGFPVEVEYVNLPAVGPDDTVVVADPMLATGSTIDAVLGHLGETRRTVVLAAVAAPEGLARVRDRHPDADLVTVAVDDHLDDDGYIVPGLGDAGDRAFGTD
jgi:uracil phosphoribosyltransferase